MEKLTSRWSLKSPLYITKKDKRYKRHLKQLRSDGFSDTETWALDSVIAEFILPRLKRFKEVINGHPIAFSENEWNGILDKMIFAFEWSLSYEEEGNLEPSEKERDANWEKYKEGMKLFAENFMDLWW